MSRDFSAYEKQLAKMQDRDNKRSSGGGSDFTWLTTNKPSRVGDQTRQRLRIVPRPDGNGGTHDEFWVTIDQHMVKFDGKTKAMVCPDDHDASGGSRVCPLCKLSRELYASRQPEHLGLAKELSARVRVFTNAVDLEDESHPEKPKVWGFSRTMHHSILDICMAKRSFIEDLEIGRDILLTTRRIGPQRFDIRYAITDMDSAPIDPAFFDIAKDGHDLESLAKPASLDELHEVAASSDPRGKSSKGGYTPEPTISTPNPVVEAAVAELAEQEVAAPAPAPAPPAPPTPPAPSDNQGEWHYSSAEGQVEGLTLAAVAKRIKASPDAQHHVWREGMSGWLDWTEVADVKAAASPKAPPAPPAPPKGGPPAPPTPRGGSAF